MVILDPSSRDSNKWVRLFQFRKVSANFFYNRKKTKAEPGKIKASNYSKAKAERGKIKAIEEKPRATREDWEISIKDQMEPSKIEVKEEKPKQTREEWVIWIKDKMEQARRDAAANSWDKLCIYRVPPYLQDNDKKSYLPQTVSIGPYHHGKEHLLPMEPHKWRALSRVMVRTEHNIVMYIEAMEKLEEEARACYQGPIDMNNSNKFTQMLVLDGCFVLELLRGANLGFTEIGYEHNDPVFTKPGLMNSIKRDMIMLENQLPLFVLNRLLELQLNTQNQPDLVELVVRFFDPLLPTSKASNESETISTRSVADNGKLYCFNVFHRIFFHFSGTSSHRTKSEDTSMVDKQQQQVIMTCSIPSDLQSDSVQRADNGELQCLDVFHRSLFQSSGTSSHRTKSEDTSMVDKQQQQVIMNCSMPSDLRSDSVQRAENGELHCLDVFHRSLFQSSGNKSEDASKGDKPQQQQIHCVTELREAGVKFKRQETGQLWDIKFEKGYLKIPKLLIHDGTKSLLLNLIAFEQCHTHSSNNITSYILFMDNLINSSEDVSYLHHYGIIEHWLGSDSEVADLFNQLCKEVTFDPKDCYLSQLSGEVNDHYNSKWNYMKATLRHKYFSNPWAYFSFSAAVILLILTCFQSFFAGYGYFKPAS